MSRRRSPSFAEAQSPHYESSPPYTVACLPSSASAARSPANKGPRSKPRTTSSPRYAQASNCSPRGDAATPMQRTQRHSPLLVHLPPCVAECAKRRHPSSAHPRAPSPPRCSSACPPATPAPRYRLRYASFSLRSSSRCTPQPLPFFLTPSAVGAAQQVRMSASLPGGLPNARMKRADLPGGLPNALYYKYRQNKQKKQLPSFLFLPSFHFLRAPRHSSRTPHSPPQHPTHLSLQCRLPDQYTRQIASREYSCTHTCCPHPPAHPTPHNHPFHKPPPPSGPRLSCRRCIAPLCPQHL